AQLLEAARRRVTGVEHDRMVFRRLYYSRQPLGNEELSPMPRLGLGEKSVVDQPDFPADRDRPAVPLVDMAADFQFHRLADPHFDAPLYRLGVVEDYQRPGEPGPQDGVEDNGAIPGAPSPEVVSHVEDSDR